MRRDSEISEMILQAVEQNPISRKDVVDFSSKQLANESIVQ